MNRTGQGIHYPRVGAPVTVLRPDRPEHRTGVVVESRGPSWHVWVKHRCDCWHAGTVTDHVWGYDESEITT